MVIEKSEQTEDRSCMSWPCNRHLMSPKELETNYCINRKRLSRYMGILSAMLLCSLLIVSDYYFTNKTCFTDFCNIIPSFNLSLRIYDEIYHNSVTVPAFKFHQRFRIEQIYLQCKFVVWKFLFHRNRLQTLLKNSTSKLYYTYTRLE